MPIYEYRCHGCQQRVSLFFRSFSTPVEAVCPNCKSTELERLISKVALPRTTEQQLLKLKEYERYMSEVDNPRDAGNVARWAEQIGTELDSELGSDFREQARQINGEEERPWDMYDPAGTLQMHLEKKRAELMGLEPVGDPWDEVYPRESGGGEPAADGGALNS